MRARRMRPQQVLHRIKYGGDQGNHDHYSDSVTCGHPFGMLVVGTAYTALLTDGSELFYGLGWGGVCRSQYANPFGYRIIRAWLGSPGRARLLSIRWPRFARVPGEMVMKLPI